MDIERRIALIFVGAGMVLGLACYAAFGHEGDTPLAEWYRSLETPSGASCCNMTDCAPVDARMEDNHWMARIDGEWRIVPDEIILKRENLEGRAVACVYAGELRCFVPPAGV